MSGVVLVRIVSVFANRDIRGFLFGVSQLGNAPKASSAAAAGEKNTLSTLKNKSSKVLLFFFC